MCDERERLITYVYGEAAAEERQQLEAHLEGCHVCRAEVSALRSVRSDLLAWEVPRHDPIWRPVTPVSEVPARRSWPTWALAAAAGVLFAAGLAGGMAARGWVPATAPAAVGAGAPEARVSAAVTSDDLARLEAAILDRVRQEMSERLTANRSAVPTPASGLSPVTSTNRPDDTEVRLAAIEQWMDDQISLNALFNGQFGRLNSRTTSLSEQFELSRMQRVGLDGGGQ